MEARIRAEGLSLDVPTFLQRDRESTGWGGLFLGAAFDPPQRKLLRLLDNINFELREGDRLAILGRNGAGKSTLLRVLNRVYQPSQGKLTVDGSCQALLNMSLGFNGEATVRENIYLRGVAMGLKASFLRGEIGQILEFSGLGEKVNHRLRTLSSGQKMRLGFAISTSVQHDIMLMDEWVGAGDADFMRKAKERMQSRVGGSKIVVLASHSTGLLRDICNRGIVLERGKLVHAGDITTSLKYYHELLAKLRAGEEIELDTPAARGAQIFGAVEEITVERDTCVIKGWLIDTEGAMPCGVALQVDGQRYAAETIERMRRPDVMRHFGLSDDACGFRVTIAIPGFSQLSELGPDLQVLGGESPDQTHAPLRIAGSITALLQSAP
ncbi:ABC transporter ATP-binding protein [Lysobacter sp. A03]|uniref:ABC transporter ATP-binding protein n=1 Tax=Lysobacter sp. A03 TaxID=1199154 RepID=UPI0005B7502D|nr:ABC transporter ATP-binding protein [Lysobacter sp. A03]KIQ97613.1 ABC transporter ATP-binding protein [Lysobacter sp. A03]